MLPDRLFAHATLYAGDALRICPRPVDAITMPQGNTYVNVPVGLTRAGQSERINE